MSKFLLQQNHLSSFYMSATSASICQLLLLLLLSVSLLWVAKWPRSPIYWSIGLKRSGSFMPQSKIALHSQRLFFHHFSQLLSLEATLPKWFLKNVRWLTLLEGDTGFVSTRGIRNSIRKKERKWERERGEGCIDRCLRSCWRLSEAWKEKR